MDATRLDQIINYFEVSPELGTAGQPLREQFAAIRAAGYQVVINLALSISPDALPGEAELVTGLGMDYIPIPVVWEAPRLEDFKRFCAEMRLLTGKKVFVHCAMNYRVSAFVYLYRSLCLDVPEDVAYRDMRSIWQPEGVWADFIDLVRHSG